MTGHIRLGAMADEELRDYALIDIERYQQSSANPFTARIATGGKYAELDTFSDWTIQDWHSGVGNNDPEAGPLFSMAETRYPGYLMPAVGWTHPLTTWIGEAGVAPADTPNELRLLSSTKYSVSFTATRSANVENFWILLHCPYGKSVTVALHEDNAGKPGTLMESKAVTSTQLRAHAHWQRFAFTAGQILTSSTRYHIVVSTTVTATLGSGIYPYMPTTTLGGSEKCYTSTDNGSTWSLTTGSGLKGFYFYYTHADMGDNYTRGIFTHNGNVFVWKDDIISRVSAGAYTTEVSGVTIYDVLQVDSLLYVSYGTGYKVYDMIADTTTDFTTDAYMLRLHSGFLWRSTGTTVSYTADEVTWVDLPDIVGATGNAITGMAGLERELYFSTREGLFVAVSGDEILQAVTWPEAHQNNGRGMVAWEGALYIPMYGGTIMRYDTSGALLNVGINAKEELPEDLQGSIFTLCPTNYFLLAAVEMAHATGYSSLWAYNVDGWHCLAIGPQGIYGGAVRVDRNAGYLYWGLDSAFLRQADYPSSINNPVRNLEDVRLAPESWVEYDRFYGSNHTLDKDFDRIYIDTEQAGRNVHVYWQDDDNYADYTVGHNGQMGWQYLGAVAEGESTIQFPAANRPGGKSFRLALRLTTKDVDGNSNPVVRGVSTKFSTNVADRWRWVLPIAVHDNQQFPDGSVNPYTAAEMLTHLDSLKNDTAPLQYVDIDGTTHYVKVTAASRQVARYEWQVGNEAPDIQWIYVFNIEQVS